MPTDNQSVIIEAFVSDPAFVDQSKSINGIFVNEGGKVAALTPKALSFFSTPSAFVDKRVANTRTVNWPAATNPHLIVDQVAFTTFVNTINALPGGGSVGLFKIIDRLFFDFNAATAHAAIETYLTTDTDISPLYVPGSFGISTTVVAGTVYLPGSTTQAVTVPASVSFSITLPTGSTTTTYAIKLFTSVDAWLTGYSVSTIEKVIPALPYPQLYTASLITTTDNIFATASLSTMLSFTTTQSVIGNISISGTSEYKAVVTDGTNNVNIPFNILFKGPPPTTFEIRNAIKDALLNSGTGDEAGWKLRIPSVFVDGRFYLIPLWDKTYTKPNQIVFPNISTYNSYETETATVLNSLGYGDITTYMDVLSLYYNRMTATAVPDQSGSIAVTNLSAVIPDYQNYAPTDPNFEYMLAATQAFASLVNQMLAIDSGAQTSLIYTPIVEGLLTFYSFTFDNYEVCVITKQCYLTILGSTQ